MIRPFEDRDAGAVTAIENYYILHSPAHFGITPITASDTLDAYAAAAGKYPWFVAEEDGKVVGFARGGPWKSREAYAPAVTIGIYVDAECQGRGIGKQLYTELFKALREARTFNCVIAGITLPNEASVRLHESFGMKHIGTFPNVGYKFGKWWGTGYWVLEIGETANA